MASKKHFIVTGGSTREYIDEVRVWGNIFTGGTGLAVARALLDLGDVTLLTSNTQHASEHDGYYGKAGMLGIETFETHAELHDLLQERMTSGDHVSGVAMAAAVADYTPAGSFRVVERKPDAANPQREVWVVEHVDAPKVKSNHGEMAVLGRQTLKLVDQFRTAWGFEGVLVKFKLEVGISEAELVKVAAASRVASGADAIVANTLEMVQGAKAGAYIITPEATKRVGRAELAGEIRDLMAALLSKQAEA